MVAREDWYRPINIEWRLTVEEARALVTRAPDARLADALLASIERVETRGRTPGALIIGYLGTASDLDWTVGSLAAARVAIKRRLHNQVLGVDGRRNLEHAYAMLQQIERDFVRGAQRRESA